MSSFTELFYKTENQTHTFDSGYVSWNVSLGQRPSKSDLDDGMCEIF